MLWMREVILRPENSFVSSALNPRLIPKPAFFLLHIQASVAMSPALFWARITQTAAKMCGEE